jgi:hypothetical protein
MTLVTVRIEYAVEVSDKKSEQLQMISVRIHNAKGGPFCTFVFASLMKSIPKKETNASMLPRVGVWMVASLLVFMLTACHGSRSAPTGSGAGILSLTLTDAQTDELEAVYITIDEVHVQIGGGVDDEDSNWQIVASPYTTYNLLTLVNGELKTLGLAELKSGLYTCIKLMVGCQSSDSNIHPHANYIKDPAGRIHKLEVPPGLQNGVTLAHPFEIHEGRPTELILDFDASKSIVKTSNSGQYLLKPTFKVMDRKEHAVLRGRVTDGNKGLPGVRVSAQKSNPGNDIRDQVVIQSMTTTDANGYYTMYLEPDIYYIVAYKGSDLLYGLSYMGCARIVTEPNTSYTENLELSPAMTGHIASIVTVDRCDADQLVSISVRKIPLCPGSSGNEQIEVTSLSVTDGVFYTVSLPARASEPEAYTVVASTKSDTVTAAARVAANTEVMLYIDFPS